MTTDFGGAAEIQQPFHPGNPLDIATAQGAAIQSPIQTPPAVPSRGYQQTIFNLVPTRDIDNQLGFPARTIIVDNNTPQWWYIPTAGTLVPPWRMRVVIPLPVATQHAQAKAVTTPPGVAIAPTISGVTTSGQITFYERLYVPSPGYGIEPDVGGAIAGLSAVTLTPGNPINNFPLPSLPHGMLAYVLPLGTGNGALTASLSLSGNVTFVDMWFQITITNITLMRSNGSVNIIPWPRPVPQGSLLTLSIAGLNSNVSITIAPRVE